MSNFKVDIEAKLIKDRTRILKNAPDFLKLYITDELASYSNELRTHITYAKNIMTFLHYYCSITHIDTKNITINDLNNISRTTIRNYLDYLTSYTSEFITSTGKKVIKVRTNTNTSKAKKLAALKKFFTYLYEQGLLKENPTEKIKITKPDITKLSNKLNGLDMKEMTEAFIEGTNISSEQQRKAYNRLKLRDTTIFLISAYTGIRVSELVSLDITDVDTTKCTIKVTRKNNKIQELPYPNEISKNIEEYLCYRQSLKNKVPEQFKKSLFLSQKMNRISDQSVRILLKKYALRININDIACHTLRRSFLSSFYNQTHDIRATAKLGGHSVATASKYYADVDEERLRAAVSSFEYK